MIEMTVVRWVEIAVSQQPANVASRALRKN